MKIISANLNGIRAAAKKGFFDWLLKESPDVVCIQETKAQQDQLDAPVFSPQGYFRYFLMPKKKAIAVPQSIVKKNPIKSPLDWAGRRLTQRVVIFRLILPICLLPPSIYLPAPAKMNDNY